MNEIIINNDNLLNYEVDKKILKVRAILTFREKILVANYGGVLLLPGGKVDIGENEDTAIIRELKEEIGLQYKINELQKKYLIRHYQKNYPTRGNEVLNRVVLTYYYLGKYKGINLNNCNRTKEEEKKI